MIIGDHVMMMKNKHRIHIVGIVINEYIGKNVTPQRGHSSKMDICINVTRLNVIDVVKI